MFFLGGIFGMVLPALLYVTFLPAGSDIRGLGHRRGAGVGDGRAAGPLMAGAIAFLGAWVLFKTQLDQMEGMVRSLTDILWTGSARVRAWRGGDVRLVYYGVLAAVVALGHHRAAARAALRPAADRRERRRRRVHHHVAARALHQHAPAAAGAAPAALAPRRAGLHGAVLRVLFVFVDFEPGRLSDRPKDDHVKQ